MNVNVNVNVTWQSRRPLSLPIVNTPREQVEDGFGCKPTALAFTLLAAFVALSATAGVSLALGAGCGPVCETVGFTLYGAALPVSAVFAALAGSLPVAWPLDTTFWLIAAFLISRFAERRAINITTVVARVVILALVYGFAISLVLEAAEP